MAKANALDADHPSPGRESTRLSTLLFGLMGAPLAWVAAQLVCSAIAQRACFPKTEPLDAAAFANTHLIQGAVLILALAISLAAILLSLGAWRRTRAEHDGGSQTLMAIGEGRSRFMAFVGLLTSLGFSIATLFSVPAVLLVPAC
jgi:hypothetical protein